MLEFDHPIKFQILMKDKDKLQQLSECQRYFDPILV